MHAHMYTGEAGGAERVHEHTCMRTCTQVKRAVLSEYAALQEHVRRVGGFDEAERVYAAPLDMDGIILDPRSYILHPTSYLLPPTS